MIRILYVTWWEAAAKNPLLDRQVGDLLAGLSERGDVEIHLLLADAFWKVRLRDRLRGEQTAADLAGLRARLPKVTIHVRQTLLAPRASRFYAHGFVRRFMAMGQVSWLRRFCARKQIDVVHCRSYPAAWVAHRAHAGSAPWRWVFDTRGHYPEEGAMTSCFPVDGPDFIAWKVMEKQMLTAADAVVNVTAAFSWKMKEIAGRCACATIPTSTNLAPFAGVKAGGERRGLVYLGALSEGGWHSPAALAWLYIRVRDVVGHRLLVITRADPVALRERLEAAGVPGDDLEFCSTQTAEETAARLSEARYAALPYRLDSGPLQDLIAETMLASKTGEYAAAGLPILCNARIGGAGELIDRHRAGLRYVSESDLQNGMASLAGRYEAAAAGARAMSEHFDIERHIESYAALWANVCADE